MSLEWYFTRASQWIAFGIILIVFFATLGSSHVVLQSLFLWPAFLFPSLPSIGAFLLIIIWLWFLAELPAFVFWTAYRISAIGEVQTKYPAKLSRADQRIVKIMVMGKWRTPGNLFRVTDDDYAYRVFWYEPPLLDANEVQWPGGSRTYLRIKDFTLQNVASSIVEVRIDATMGESPTAAVMYYGFGTRYGPLEKFGIHSVTLWFKTRELANSFFKKTQVPDDPNPAPRRSGSASANDDLAFFVGAAAGVMGATNTFQSPSDGGGGPAC